MIAVCILTFALIDSEYCEGRTDSNNEDTSKNDRMKMVVRVELINGKLTFTFLFVIYNRHHP